MEAPTLWDGGSQKSAAVLEVAAHLTGSTPRNPRENHLDFLLYLK
jgi:hypothetical protein